MECHKYIMYTEIKTQQKNLCCLEQIQSIITIEDIGSA